MINGRRGESCSGHDLGWRIRSVRRVTCNEVLNAFSTAFMWPAGAPVIKGAKNRLFDLEGPPCAITSWIRRRSRLGRKRTHALTQSLDQTNTCGTEPDPGGM